MEQKINEVYLLCMMFGNETEILGVFTKEKKLLEAYDILMNEDGRCREEKYIGKRHFSQKPIIYKTPLDKFLGRKEEWYLDNEYIFLDTIDEYEVDIEKLRRKIAEFDGFEVYCDFDEMTEARFSIFYHCDEEFYQGEINVLDNQILGNFPEHMQSVLQEWYKDNRKLLCKIWKTRKLQQLPDWEE